MRVGLYGRRWRHKVAAFGVTAGLALRVSTAAADTGARHPCTKAEDLGDGRYVRKSVVVFPLEVTPDGVVVTGDWTGDDPTGASLPGPESLVQQVAAGLFAVDWPLRRFDAWHTVQTPVLDDIGVLEQGTEALRCADAAVIPRLVEAQLTVDGKAAKVLVTLGLDVYQRDEQGRLAPTDYLRASAPGLVDRVEDVMVGARRQSVDKVLSALPQKKLDQAELAGDVVLELLPADQAAKVEAVAQQAALGATRVASVARPATVLPTLERGTDSPGIAGLRWRAEEDQCYLKPPGDDDIERHLPCATLSRVRQAVRDLQLQTRRIDAFRLMAPVADNGTPLGEAEGLRVGDGYFVEGPDGSRAGYARVRRLGIGGRGGEAAPSVLQLVYGSRAAGVRVRENPQLGIEIGGAGGVFPAARPDATLPSDPIDGGARSIRAATFAPAGTLRFDVNLGRTAKMYEWYQTNRVSRALAGPLQHTAATFGLERRVQIVPRTSLLLGAGVTVGSWSIPSGEVKLDDQGDPSEIRASASRIGGDLEAGLSVMLSPSLVLRASAGRRLSSVIQAFSWSDDERSGTVVPGGVPGAFRLRTAGLVAGASTAWVF